MAANFSLGEAVLGTRILMDGINQGIGQVESSLRGGLSGAATSAMGFFESVFSVGIGGIVTQAINGVGASIMNLGNSLIAGNAQFEMFEAQFVILTGSTDQAKQHMADLSKFAATTPFELPEVIQASKNLLTFGGAAFDTMENINKVGNAAAATNQSAMDGFTDLADYQNLSANILASFVDTINTLFAEFSARSLVVAADIAKAIIDGIANGIKTNAEIIKTALLAAIQSAMDAAKTALQIASPSQLFADQIGAPIAEGIMLGFQAKSLLLADGVGCISNDALVNAQQSVTNYNVQATYRYQDERSVRDDLTLLTMLKGKRYSLEGESEMFQRNQLNKPGTISKLSLSNGRVVQVKTPNPLQFLKLQDFPPRPWFESEAAQEAYERWMGKLLPSVACDIDQDALAQLRAEMAALEMQLPDDDRLCWIAYGCAADPRDLELIVRALAPRIK